MYRKVSTSTQTRKITYGSYVTFLSCYLHVPRGPKQIGQASSQIRKAATAHAPSVSHHVNFDRSLSLRTAIRLPVPPRRSGTRDQLCTTFVRRICVPGRPGPVRPGPLVDERPDAAKCHTAVGFTANWRASVSPRLWSAAIRHVDG